MKSEKTREMENQLNLIKDFVKENKVGANNNGCECPDGRYTAEQSDGRIRLFGSDLGVLMAIRGALTGESENLSTRELINRYYNFLETERGEDAIIYYHTDNHNPLPKIGCGHVAKAASGDYEKFYGVSAKDALEIWDEIQKFEHAECQILEGEHKEQGVLMVYGNDFSVNSQSRDGKEMYFVIDVDRTNDLLRKVANALKINELTARVLQDSYWKQVNTTAMLLAKGLPRFEINLGVEENKVKFIGNVPELV